MSRAKKDMNSKKRARIAAARRAERLRRRAERLRRLVRLALLLDLLDRAKIWGATVATWIIASSHSRTKNLSAEREEPKKIENNDVEPKPQRGRISPSIYSGRYAGRRPHLSDLIRDLALPGSNGEEAFAELLKQLPREIHGWARVMFADCRDRAFKIAIRNQTVGAPEAIENMQTAARRWQWEQDERIQERKLELGKKFKRDQEANEVVEYNPR